MRRALVLALVTVLSGCAVSRASSMPVSKELAADCARHCGALEMRLAAVVVVASAGGCVCEPVAAPQAPQAPRAGGAAAAAGGAMVTSIAAEQKQQQQTMTSTPPEAPSVR